MSTILYSDVRFYEKHFAAMAQEWNKIDTTLRTAVDSVKNYYSEARAHQELKNLPPRLLKDIGIEG